MEIDIFSKKKIVSLKELNEQRKEGQNEQIKELEDVFKKMQQFNKDVQQLKYLLPKVLYEQVLFFLMCCLYYESQFQLI